MSAALQQTWTREAFFAWAGARDGRYEFDGIRPVAMTGASINHNRIMFNIHVALRERLNGSGCSALGGDAGVATIGEAVRYPDAVVTCTPVIGTSLLVPEPSTIFEILSPTSGRRDRIIKVGEYGAIPTLRRYVIVEADSAGLLVLSRHEAAQAWTTAALTGDDTLAMPELGIEVPVAAFYQDVLFSELDAS